MQKGVLLFSAAVMLGLTGCMSYEEIRGKADAGAWFRQDRKDFLRDRLDDHGGIH